MSFFKKLRDSIVSKMELVIKQFKDGLEKICKGFVEKVFDFVICCKKIDEEFYEELEEILIGVDVGVNIVMILIEDLCVEVKKCKIEDVVELQFVLFEKLIDFLCGE